MHAQIEKHEKMDEINLKFIGSKHWECDCIQLPSAEEFRGAPSQSCDGSSWKAKASRWLPHHESNATLRLLGASLFV